MFGLFKKKETRQISPFDFFPVGYRRDISGYLNSCILTAVRFYQNLASELPIYVCRPSGEKAREHPVSILLNNPSPIQNKSVFYQRAIYNLLMYGNAYIRIVSDDELFLYWNRGDCFSYQVGKQRTPEARTYYRTFTEGVFSAEDFLHVREPYGSLNSYGQSRLALAEYLLDQSSSEAQVTSSVVKENFNLKLINERMGGDRGDPEKIKTQGTDLHDWLVNTGLKVLTKNPQQKIELFNKGDFNSSNFVTLKQAIQKNIFQLFLIPRQLYDQDRATYRIGLESLNIFIRTGLAPLLSLFESEFENKLLSVPEKKSCYKIQFDLRGLLRSDPASQAEIAFKSLGQKLPWLSVNEVRESLGYGPMAGEDNIKEIE